MESGTHEDDWEYVAEISCDGSHTKWEHSLEESNEFPSLMKGDDYLGDPMADFRCTSESESDMDTIEADLASHSTGFDSPVKVEAPSSMAGDKPVCITKKLSFKDMLLLNSEEQQRKAQADADAEKAQRLAMPPRRRMASRLVVQPIARGTRRPVGIFGEDQTHATAVVDEDDFGAMDAPEFYARKDQGAHARNIGRKIRPDEAKRKAYAQNKRNMQRMQHGH